jgi:hypothetical protein
MEEDFWDAPIPMGKIRWVRAHEAILSNFGNSRELLPISNCRASRVAIPLEIVLRLEGRWSGRKDIGKDSL